MQIQVPAFLGLQKNTEKKVFFQKMFVKASHRSKSSLKPLDLHGGLLRSWAAPWPPDCGTPHCIASTMPIYGAFLILFQALSVSLSLGLFHRALHHSLMRGKNTTAMKSLQLLTAFFSKLALSSPPERFLQIPVWGIVNTNFSLLKSPHIPAMLSFEWQTQGRPLNSFIVGFKTLHFKKYKSYSQMNEGETGDWREGLLMCPVGLHELNLSPQAAQIHSPVRWLRCPYDPAHMAPIYSRSLPQSTLKHTHIQTQCGYCFPFPGNHRYWTAWQW